MCLNPKVACTTWKRVLLRLTGKSGAIKVSTKNRNNVHIHGDAFVGRLYRENASQRVHYLSSHYYKALFVREPLERLISGYRDRILREPLYRHVRQRIKEKFRSNVSSKSVKFTLAVLTEIQVMSKIPLNNRSHRQNVTVLRSNTIFCDICCFRCAIWRISSLKGFVNC